MSFIGKAGTGLVTDRVKKRFCKRCLKIFPSYLKSANFCEACRKHSLPERFVVR